MKEYDLKDVERYAIENEYYQIAEIVARSKFPLRFQIAITQLYQSVFRYRVRVPGKKLAYRWEYLNGFRDRDVLEFAFKPLTKRDENVEYPTVTRIWYEDDDLWYRLRRDPWQSFARKINDAIDYTLFQMKYATANFEIHIAYNLHPVTLPFEFDEE